MWSPFGPLWSVKYLNFRQKLPIWTAHHISDSRFCLITDENVDDDDDDDDNNNNNNNNNNKLFFAVSGQPVSGELYSEGMQSQNS